MARKRIVAGNWKMNMTIEEGRNWLRSFSRHHDLAQLVEEVIIFPPFTALAALANDEQGNLLQWGGQNLHEAGAGAYTGEISGPMIRDCHAGWVLVGHSERRTLFQEQDDLISRKMRRAIDSDLQPILCVGETLEERESGQFMEVVARQVVRGLADFPQHALDRLVIAYEPVWAIGTGKTASPQDAQDMHQHIRKRCPDCIHKLLLRPSGSCMVDLSSRKTRPACSLVRISMEALLAEPVWIRINLPPCWVFANVVFRTNGGFGRGSA